MRLTSLAWVIGTTAVPVLAAFAGCGGNVSLASSSTGTGGTGGKTSVSVTSSSTVMTDAVSTSNVAASTAGTGGLVGAGGSPPDAGSPCDQACAHAASCGFDVCSMFMINCANVPAMYDCVLTCLNGVDCSNFQQGAFACYQQCQNMGNDGGPPPFDGGPPPFDGGGFDAGPGLMCGQCAVQSCQQQSFACGMDMSPGGCFGWLQCQGACYQASPIDPTCFDNCDAMFPNAAPLYEPVYACTCQNCGTQCAAGDPCSHVGDGG